MAPDPAAPLPTTVTGTVRQQFQQLANDAGEADSHGVVLEALRELSKKPGWQTTEFYLSLVIGFVGTVMAQMPGKELYGAILASTALLSYNLSRGIAKKAAVFFLALGLTLGASGCSSVDVKNDAHAALIFVDQAITAAQADPTLIPKALDAVDALDASNAKLLTITNQLKGSITTGRLGEAHAAAQVGIALVTTPPPASGQ